MKSESDPQSWSLEVVRGPDTGHRLPLAQGTVLLGNALDGTPGLDLSNLERDSPRKMAGKHARIDVQNGSLSLRDLNSPGGTFVDRRRVPPGSDLPLKDGDLIQLGGVQLRVVRGDRNGTSTSRTAATIATAKPTAPVHGAVLTLATGASCRTWDDVVTIAAQKWSELRDELSSGRLAASLIATGRADLAPDPKAPGSLDERLDAWIGRLPATKPASPELEVHPRTVVIRGSSGGGATRKKIQISNVGYRLLRTTARVEPAEATWLRLAPEFSGTAFSTVDQTDLAFDAIVPESFTSPLTARIVLDSNGGAVTISVRVEPASAKDEIPVAEPSTAPRESISLRERIQRQPVRSRLIFWPMIAGILRLVVGVANGFMPVTGDAPGLLGPVVLFAILGGLVALVVGARGSETRDQPWILSAGCILGAMVAALFVAAIRVIESPLAGAGGMALWMAVPAWCALLAALAYGSSLIIPAKPTAEPKP